MGGWGTVCLPKQTPQALELSLWVLARLWAELWGAEGYTAVEGSVPWDLGAVACRGLCEGA